MLNEKRIHNSQFSGLNSEKTSLINLSMIARKSNISENSEE